MSRISVLVVSVIILVSAVGCDEPNQGSQVSDPVIVEGIYDHSSYAGDRWSATIIHFSDGSTYVLKDVWQSVPFPRGTKIRVYKARWVDEFGYRVRKYKIEKVEER